jgi:hypothetical protein
MVVKDQNLRVRLAAAARQTIEQRFTLGRMVDQLEGIFAQLVAQAEGSVDQT